MTSVGIHRGTTTPGKTGPARGERGSKMVAENNTEGGSRAVSCASSCDEQIPADSARHPRTGRVTGEKAREKKLREDELIIVISPQLVQCKRCHRRIKLSLKSHYDPAHWTQHRKRCLLKDPSVEEGDQAPATWPTESKVRVKRRPSSKSTTPPLLSPTDNGPLSPISSPDSIWPSSSLSSPPPSPLTLIHHRHSAYSPISAPHELSHQAFERVHQWNMFGHMYVPHYLGEPYDVPQLQFEESQVRMTCE